MKNMVKQKADIKEAFENLLMRLERMILIGEIKPRERLIEADLSQRLDVSRAWIRDALKLLQAKGLVTVVPYKGAMVAELTKDEVEEIFFVRVALEKLCYQVVVENIRPEHIQHLRHLASEIEKAFQMDRFDQMVTANSAFHEYIYDLCENKTLIQMLMQLKTRFFIFNTIAWSIPEALETVLREHWEFISAFESKNLDALNQLAEKHFSYSKELYLRQMG